MKKILSALAALVALTACNSSEPKAEAAATADGNAQQAALALRGRHQQGQTEGNGRQ